MLRDPLRVAVLASWRADGLDGLMGGESRFEVVAGVVTEPASPAAHLLDHRRVPRALRDLRGFCLRRGVPLSDPDARRAFDEQTVKWLRPFRPDLIVLCGYGYRLAEPLLEAWPNRVLGIHDADLRLRNANGGPRYPGLRAVRDTILAGEPEIRSTVYIVTAEIDAGPSLVISGPCPVSLPADVRGEGDGIGAYAAVHRERMIRDCWAPLLKMAVELFARGRVEVTSDSRVFVDGRPAPLVLAARAGRSSPLVEVA